MGVNINRHVHGYIIYVGGSYPSVPVTLGRGFLDAVSSAGCTKQKISPKTDTHVSKEEVDQEKEEESLCPASRTHCFIIISVGNHCG